MAALILVCLAPNGRGAVHPRKSLLNRKTFSPAANSSGIIFGSVLSVQGTLVKTFGGQVTLDISQANIANIFQETLSPDMIMPGMSFQAFVQSFSDDKSVPIMVNNFSIQLNNEGSLVGKIENIDYAASAITIYNQKILITEDTVLRKKNAKIGKLTDFKTGDPVILAFVDDGNNLTARYVDYSLFDPQHREISAVISAINGAQLELLGGRISIDAANLPVLSAYTCRAEDLTKLIPGVRIDVFFEEDAAGGASLKPDQIVTEFLDEGSIAGTIQAIDSAGDGITLDNLPIAIDAGTVIQNMQGEHIKLDKLKVGKRVGTVVELAGARLTASLILKMNPHTIVILASDDCDKASQPQVLIGRFE
jgi:hypothetical protein